jgi:predicted dithiol-disulfide oxidoreductase (DUF899 family)
MDRCAQGLSGRGKSLQPRPRCAQPQTPRIALGKSREELLFDTPAGKQSLADLFGGKSQLIIYHFMLGPGWEAGCPSCSYLADHFDGAVVHLAQRDVSFVVVSRAPLSEIEAFKRRMGWRFKWVSSFGSEFNPDYQVSVTPQEKAGGGKVMYNYEFIDSFPSEERPGASVFYKNAAGEIFHTYSTYGRGLDMLIGTYHFLDLAPKGRDEEGLAWSMAWVRHHDRYEGAVVDTKASYREPKSASCCDYGVF